MKSKFKIYEIHENSKGNVWDSTYLLIEPTNRLNFIETDTREEAVAILSEDAIVFIKYVILEVFQKE